MDMSTGLSDPRWIQFNGGKGVVDMIMSSICLDLDYLQSSIGIFMSRNLLIK